MNHALLAQMLMLARGHSLREIGPLLVRELSTDLVLATLGVGVAAFWDLEPVADPLRARAAVLIHRSLACPRSQAEARIDPKTGLFNARHFAVALAEELARAQRFDRPMSLIMADLDLLRDINNTLRPPRRRRRARGHRRGLPRSSCATTTSRPGSAARSSRILLPETRAGGGARDRGAHPPRRRRAAFDVDTSSEPIRATVSLGVASSRRDGTDANELIHQADLAVYRAKLQGRNRVARRELGAVLAGPIDREPQLAAVPPTPASTRAAAAGRRGDPPEDERRHPRPHAVHGPRFFSLSRALALLVALVGSRHRRRRLSGSIFGTSHRLLRLLALVALVGVGQALALEVDDGSISVSAVGALAGAALFGREQRSRSRSPSPRSTGARAGRRSTRSSSTSAR